MNSKSPKHRILFAYWGRKGALCRFTLDLAHAALEVPSLDPVISISENNELSDEFEKLGSILLPVKTFDTPVASLRVDKLIELRNRVATAVKQRGIDTVITLMPHVWSPLVSGAVRKAGARYAVVVHDANSHPGDATATVNRWLLSDLRHADIVFTLSQSVAGSLRARRLVEWRRLHTLFHPDFNYGPRLSPRFPAADEAFRILVIGRLLKYKALPMLVDALEALQQTGRRFELGIFGEGDISDLRGRLHSLGATVVNEWIADADIRRVCSCYHAVVLSHLEASQSGIIATAHGLGIPVIVTPVGGLPEQVRHMETGIVTRHASHESIAEAIRSLSENADLYEHIVETIDRTRNERSMARFVSALIEYTEDLPLPVS